MENSDNTTLTLAQSRQAVIEHITAKEKEMAAIASKLKQDFVGLDAIIDQLMGNIKIWYIFPELQLRPTIVCLWGLTGVGKTDMIRKMVSYMNMQDRFLEIEMQGENSPDKKIQRRLESSSISPEETCILFLDEFQKFRTVNEDGTVNNNNTAYSDVWTLLSDGKFQSDLSRKTELLEQLLYSKYYKDWEDTEKANKKEDKTASTPATTNITVKRKYQTPVYLARKVKRLFKIPNTLEEIMQWSDEEIVDLYDKCANNSALLEGDTFKKMLIILGGNLDEAYRIAHDVGEADADADCYHEQSKRITPIDIKYALCRRFRPEQIARFGNSHILYPSLSRQNYGDIIIRKCKEVSNLIENNHHITITYDPSVYKVMYDNGVFPTQGVRPLLSTITNILSSALPTFIFKCLVANTPSCRLVVKEDIMSTTIAGETLEVVIPTVLDEIRKEITSDYKHLVAVHELGHAIVYCVLYGSPPKQICANSTSSYKNGFIIPHNFIPHKDGELKNIQLFLAGTVAEAMVFGSDFVGTGSENDISNATAKAWAMLGRWGLEKYASSLTQKMEDFRNILPKNFQDECERIVAEAKKTAADILHKHLNIYKEMLPILLHHEMLTEEDFIKVFKSHGIRLTKIEPKEELVIGYGDLTKKFLTNSVPSSLYVEAVHIDGTATDATPSIRHGSMAIKT